MRARAPGHTACEVIGMQPTQKETGLLKDLKDQEQLCVDKYRRHAASANDPQLKNLFEQLAQVEQQHLDAIAQMMQGTVCKPADSATVPGTFTAAYSSADSPQKQNDCYLCSDVLTMEKHASHLYDTCVFEFRDADARSVLNDIQAQEQYHGKVIWLQTPCTPDSIHAKTAPPKARGRRFLSAEITCRARSSRPASGTPGASARSVSAPRSRQGAHSPGSQNHRPARAGCHSPSRGGKTRANPARAT